MRSLLGDGGNLRLSIEVGDFVVVVFGEGFEEFGGRLLEDSLGFGSGDVGIFLVLEGGDEPGGEVFSTSELRENDLFILGELGGGWGGVQGLHGDDLHWGLVGEFFSFWLHL